MGNLSREAIQRTPRQRIKPIARVKSDMGTRGSCGNGATAAAMTLRDGIGRLTSAVGLGPWSPVLRERLDLCGVEVHPLAAAAAAAGGAAGEEARLGVDPDGRGANPELFGRLGGR